jgi:hypothetical protein
VPLKWVNLAHLSAKSGCIICSLLQSGQYLSTAAHVLGIEWGKSGRFQFYSASQSEQILLWEHIILPLFAVCRIQHTIYTLILAYLFQNGPVQIVSMPIIFIMRLVLVSFKIK